MAAMERSLFICEIIPEEEPLLEESRREEERNNCFKDATMEWNRKRTVSSKPPPLTMSANPYVISNPSSITPPQPEPKGNVGTSIDPFPLLPSVVQEVNEMETPTYEPGPRHPSVEAPHQHDAALDVVFVQPRLDPLEVAQAVRPDAVARDLARHVQVRRVLRVFPDADEPRVRRDVDITNDMDDTAIRILNDPLLPDAPQLSNVRPQLQPRQPVPVIYHEKQDWLSKLDWGVCGVHTVNNVLQRQQYDYQDFNDICYRLDNSSWINPYKSMFGFGDYDANVLSVALGRQGYNLDWHDRRRVGELHAHLNSSYDSTVGILINKYIAGEVCMASRHWYALRKINGRWYDLDSNNMQTRVFRDQNDLVDFVANVIRIQGAFIFLVKSRE